MPSAFRQDMPPQGGFGAIQWARQTAGKKLSGAKSFAALSFVMTVGYIQVVYIYRQRRWQKLEMRESYIALEPFCKAERDRRMLKWMGRLREEEQDVMKNVPFWEVGKWYNRPIYHNLANRWIPFSSHDIYPYCSISAVDSRFHQKYWEVPNHNHNNAKWDRE